ncbi:MAG: DUF4430 domain-containing protein [Bacillota bacterium]
MSNWLALLWRKKNYLLGVFAVLAIVLATVWIYSGNSEQSKGVIHTASSAALGQETAELDTSKDNFEDNTKDTSGDSTDSSTDTTVTKPNGATSEVQSEQPTVAPSGQNEAGNEENGSKTGSETSKAEKSTEQDTKEASSSEGKKSASGEPGTVTESAKGESPIAGKTIDSSKKVPPSEKGTKASSSSSSTVKNKDTAAMKGKPDSGKQVASPSTDNTPAPEPEVAPSSSNTVRITIVGSPDVGTIMSTKEIDIGDSETVLDILKKTTRSLKIQMDYSGSGASAYIKGIDNLYEFDKGAGSGWMYSVNNKFPNRSAGVWSIHPGDHIQWLYTEDLGKDVGAGVDNGLWDGKS